MTTDNLLPPHYNRMTTIGLYVLTDKHLLAIN